MKKMMISPARYIQGAGVLRDTFEEVKKLGDSALIICDDFVWDICGENYCTGLNEKGISAIRRGFGGESTDKEVSILAGVARDNTVEMVIGLGGGKTLDVAKAVADTVTSAVVIVPTTASTDAPTSAISVMYDELGVFQQYKLYHKSPDLVILDTEIICQAPAKLLAAGIADGLSTWIEAKSVIDGNGVNLLGARPTIAAQAIAEKCEEILFAYGEQAMISNQAKVVTEAFEAVVEANTLLSGIGFESCGLAFAHALHNAFTVLEGDIKFKSHGEKVAFGTLVQLVLQNESKERFDKFYKFYQKLSLPTSLEELGLAQVSQKELELVAKQALNPRDTTSQMPFSVTSDEIVAAIIYTDSYGV